MRIYVCVYIHVNKKKLALLQKCECKLHAKKLYEPKELRCNVLLSAEKLDFVKCTRGSRKIWLKSHWDADFRNRLAFI